MTINEMLKKVATFNEMAEMLNVARFNQKVCLYMIDTSVISTTYCAKDSKSFKKLIKDTYIDEYAKDILDYKDYEFNTPVTFKRTDVFGHEDSMTIEFCVCDED